MAIALQAAPAMGAGIEEAAIRALGTIRQVMPSRLRHRLDALEVTTIGRAGDAAPVTMSVDVLVTLAQTTRDRESLRFDYPARDVVDTDERQPLPPRRVELHHLVTSYGRWYLVGWDLDRDDWRFYSVDRIHPRVPHGPPFTPRTAPGGDVDKFVSARFTGSDVTAWPCCGAAIDEHTCSLEAGSWSWSARAASFGRFDAPIDVVGPPELASAFATLAERYATGRDRPRTSDLR